MPSPSEAQRQIEETCGADCGGLTPCVREPGHRGPHQDHSRYGIFPDERVEPKIHGWYDQYDRDGLERLLARTELRLERVNADRSQVRLDLTRERASVWALLQALDEEEPAVYLRVLDKAYAAYCDVLEEEDPAEVLS